HHIIADGWSMGIFTREIASLYEAFSDGERSPLRDLPLQYADYVIWQRDWLSGEVLEGQIDYWRRQLVGAEGALLRLPSDHPRSPVCSYRGASQSFAILPDLSQDLTELSRQNGVTAFMTLFATFLTLLYRYTGQQDILVGYPIANRNRVEIEELIGLFANTVVLRGDIHGDPTFLDLLGQVRQTCLGAYANQDLPFEKLVEYLQPERDLSYNPLFQVMFVFRDVSSSVIELSKLLLAPLDIETQTAKFDLTLSITRSEHHLIGSFEYSTDLFEAGTITNAIRHFQNLLESIAADASQRVSEVPMVSQSERSELLAGSQDTRAGYDNSQCLHRTFETRVELTPEAEAVVFEDEQVTYGELNRRANQVAWHLRNLGVAPEDVIGVCQRRSPEIIISLLGILKSGAAYVAIDPDSILSRG
ncbi:MAG: condensation domain-containing protein, partial [Blastocatellia bacterium]